MARTGHAGASAEVDAPAMTSKLLVAGLTSAVAFLLVTNPVVVDAAGQVTGKQIKNSSVTGKDLKDESLQGKDVKDASLTSADLAAGTIPVPVPPPTQVKQLKRVAATGDTAFPAIIDPTFAATPATVTVDGNDVVSAWATVHVVANTAGDDTDVAICVRAAGSAAAPSILGGAPSNNADIDLLLGDNLLAPQASDVLPAGSYSVGPCIHPLAAMTVKNVAGNVIVVDGSGPLGP
jgi:hypothetical protein